MWEMEGRTTEEIATALNTSPANVRHILVRARKSMVRVLEEWIVDEETGLTALNALSTTYKKAAHIAQKSSKAALSLILVITAFLGFNSLGGNEASLTAPVAQIDSTPAATSPTASASATAQAAAAAQAALDAKKKAQIAALNAKVAPLTFYGLDKDGVPTGFSVTDSNNVAGIARITKGITGMGADGFTIANQFITSSVGPNILLDQTITVDASGTHYDVAGINIGFAGNWSSINTTNVDSSVERLANGQYLITATIFNDYLNETDFILPTGRRGYDLADAPKKITTRILLNSGKSQILAQAVQVSG